MRKFRKEKTEIINRVPRKEVDKESLRNIAAVIEIIVGVILVGEIGHILFPLSKLVAIIVFSAGLIVVFIGAMKIYGYRILPERSAKKENKRRSLKMNQNTLSATKKKVIKESAEPLDVEKVKEEVIGLLNFWLKLDRGEYTRLLRYIRKKSERAREMARKIRKIAAKRIKYRLLRNILRIFEKWARFGIVKAKGKAKDLFREENRFRRAIAELKNDNPQLSIEILGEYIKSTPMTDISGDPGGYLYNLSAVNLIRKCQEFIKTLRQLKCR